MPKTGETLSQSSFVGGRGPARSTIESVPSNGASKGEVSHACLKLLFSFSRHIAKWVRYNCDFSLKAREGRQMPHGATKHRKKIP